MSDRLQEHKANDVTIVQFKDETIRDEVNIQQIGKELNVVAEGLGHQKLLLNFSSVLMVSSAMLAKLISLQKRMERSGSELTLCNLHNDLKQVFKITGLTTFFHIFEDQESALASFK